MSNSMKIVVFIIILLSIAAASNTMSMKMKARQIVLDSQGSISMEYDLISATYLSSTEELFPIEDQSEDK